MNSNNVVGDSSRTRERLPIRAQFMAYYVVALVFKLWATGCAWIKVPCIYTKWPAAPKIASQQMLSFRLQHTWHHRRMTSAGSQPHCDHPVATIIWRGPTSPSSDAKEKNIFMKSRKQHFKLPTRLRHNTRHENIITKEYAYVTNEKQCMQTGPYPRGAVPPKFYCVQKNLFW